MAISNVEDVFKQADDVAPEQRDDWTEVQNTIQALNYAVERLETLPLSNRLLKETHAILLQGVRVAVAHYQFETIHPFLDGNGRLGRLLIPLPKQSNKVY